MTHIAWLGKKSPFCGNVTYGLTTTEALRLRGHEISFIHFDTPVGAEASSSGSSSGPEVALPYLVKSQVYTIPSPGAQRELRESLERLRPDLVHASLTLSPLDFRLPDLCQQLGVPLVATFRPPFDASLRNLSAGTQQLTYQLYAPSLARYDRVVVFSELQAEVLARAHVRPRTYVLFMKPAGFPAGWTDTNLWHRAATLPDAVVMRDDNGSKARRLGAETSGQIVLYDAHGSLLFSGGITGSRGHAGDNPGRAAVVSFLNYQSADRRTTSVFGCPLFAPAR